MGTELTPITHRRSATMAEAATVPAKTESSQPRRPAPFDMLEALQEEMTRLWGQAWPHSLLPISRRLAQMSPGASMWTPRVDVFEKDGNLVVKAELPGAKKEDIEVTLDDGDLVVRGEKKSESEVKDEHYYRMERSCGSFYRRLSLPFETAAESIQATFTDGILEVRIPKPAAVDRPKAQSIKVS
jgi:HSP20 family protein